MSTQFPFDIFFGGNDADENAKKGQKVEPVEEETPPKLNKLELWRLQQGLLEILQKKIPPTSFKIYFETHLSIKEIRDDAVIFFAPSDIIKNAIEESFMIPLVNAVEEKFGEHVKTIIEVHKFEPPPPPKEDENRPKTPAEEGSPHHVYFKTPRKSKNARDVKFTIDLVPTQESLKDQVDSVYLEHIYHRDSGPYLDPKKVFESFIVGPSNTMAFAAAKAVADRPGKEGRYPTVYFYGPSGLGKTHLLHSIGNEILKNNPALTVYLVTGRDFVKELVDSIQHNKIGDFQKKYTDHLDILMIDDIHELKNKKGTQNEFFHIFNELYQKGKQLIFTSDLNPSEIDGLEERIKTRLHWGLVVDVKAPDYETRLAILKRKCVDMDLFVPEGVLEIIATHIRNSIRELEGALIKLAAYTEVMKLQIDSSMAKELLGLKEGGNPTEKNIEHIAKTCAFYFRIPLVDIKSRARTKSITDARHSAMYIAQKRTTATLSDIGLYFGGRDHTSVIHGIKKIKDQMQTDVELSHLVNVIDQSIQQ